MTTGNRRIGLVALAFAVVLLGSMAAISAVAPSAGYYAMTVAGNQWGDTTAVSQNRTAAAVIYLDGSTSSGGSTSGYGVVSDSRPTEGNVVATELFLSQDVSATLTGRNLRNNGPFEYRTYSSSFSAQGVGAGTVTAGYASMPTGGTISLAQPSTIVQPANLNNLIVGDSKAYALPLLRRSDTVIVFGGVRRVDTTGFVIKGDSAVAAGLRARVYHFSDSRGLISSSDSVFLSYGAADSVLWTAPNLETSTWNRLYIEGRSAADSSPLFMRQVNIFAASQRGDSTPNVQHTVRFGLDGAGTTQADTMTIDTAAFGSTTTRFVIAAALLKADSAQLLMRADSNAGIIVGAGNVSFSSRRLPNTTRTWAIMDTDGVLINPTASLPMSYQLNLNLLSLGITDTANVVMARLDPALLTWVTVSTTPPTATGILSASLSRQGIYALLARENATPAAAGSGGGCVIDATIGRTGFAGVMPALRSARDMVLGSSFGRLFVSGYYGFAAILMIAAVGFGTTLVSEKK